VTNLFRDLLRTPPLVKRRLVTTAANDELIVDYRLGRHVPEPP